MGGNPKRPKSALQNYRFRKWRVHSYKRKQKSQYHSMSRKAFLPQCFKFKIKEKCWGWNCKFFLHIPSKFRKERDLQQPTMVSIMQRKDKNYYSNAFSKRKFKYYLNVKVPYHIFLYRTKFSSTAINKYIESGRLVGHPTTCICKRWHKD